MFAERLKRAMEYRNKTITDISINCGLSKGLLSNYLNGKFIAKQKNIYIIAKYLEISPSYLLGITDQMIITTRNVLNCILPENTDEYKRKENQRFLIDEITSICSFQDEETLRTILTIVKSLDKRKGENKQ